MKITGHKTRAMFDRYKITPEHDRADAAARVSAAKNSPRKGQGAVTVFPLNR